MPEKAEVEADCLPLKALGFLAHTRQWAGDAVI